MSDSDGSDEESYAALSAGVEKGKKGAKKRPPPAAAANNDAPTGGMADAFSRILGQRLPESVDLEAGPMLAKRKTKQMKEHEAEKVQRKKLKADRAAKKALKEVGLHKPDYKDIDHERSLRRIATRGVVALFNAIAKQQHALEAGDPEDAAGSARDVKQLAKDNFIQMLKGGGANASKSKTSASNNAAATDAAATVAKSKKAGRKGGGSDDDEGSKGASSWLKDDFMTGRAGRSIRDWERHDERGGSDEDEGGDDGDFDDEDNDENGDDPFAADNGDESAGVDDGEGRSSRSQRVRKAGKAKQKAQSKKKGGGGKKRGR